VSKVNQISFNGQHGLQQEQKTMFITERAVFRMSDDGLVVTEIAPGIRLREDVLDQIDFELQVLPELPLMDSRILRQGRMGLLEALQENPSATPWLGSNHRGGQAR
jgi:propionate CoA-transferase